MIIWYLGRYLYQRLGAVLSYGVPYTIYHEFPKIVVFQSYPPLYSYHHNLHSHPILVGPSSFSCVKSWVSLAPYPAKMMVSGVRIKKQHVCACMRATSSRSIIVCIVPTYILVLGVVVLHDKKYLCSMTEDDVRVFLSLAWHAMHLSKNFGLLIHCVRHWCTAIGDLVVGSWNNIECKIISLYKNWRYHFMVRKADGVYHLLYRTIVASWAPFGGLFNTF